MNNRMNEPKGKTTSSSSAASQTKLPPSPERRAAQDPLFFLDHNNTNFTTSNSNSSPSLLMTESSSKQKQQQQQQQQRRLVSLAHYGSFQPHALAAASSNTVSLGAIQGAHGVALWNWNKPQTPLLLLLQQQQQQPLYTTTTTTNTASSFYFSPDATYLASTRGTGILIWNVSGQATSPLWGRLDCTSTSTNNNTNNITNSLCWRSPETLVSTTASVASLWDLRQGTQPTLRFGLRQHSETAALTNPYIQIACHQQDSDDDTSTTSNNKNNNECALLDASGVLRIYDLRHTEQPLVAKVRACRYAGVGLQAMSSSGNNNKNSNESSSWVTWGFDDPDTTTAVVRVWGGSSSASSSISPSSASHPKSNNNKEEEDEDCWYMDTSPAKTTPTALPCLGSCAAPHLACARVCPGGGASSQIVTLETLFSHDPTTSTNKNSPAWKATLWKVPQHQSKPSISLEQVTSFVGGPDVQDSFHLESVGNLIAAELTLLTQPTTTTLSATANSNNHRDTLLLCTLTDRGYVATHAIPEALPDQPKEEEKPLAPVTHDRLALNLETGGRLFPSEREVAMTDAARIWNGSAVEQRGADGEPERLDSLVSEGGGELTPPPPPPSSSVAAAAPLVAALLATPDHETGPSATNATEQEPTTVVRKKHIDTDRIPCPRLCGATFSAGVGGLVMFQNGDVRKLWNWWASTSLMTHHRTVGDETVTKRDFPRTLQDVDDMTTAAKAAQWGDESEASSASIRGDTFFEDDSEASSDSAGEAEEFMGGGGGEKDPKDLYSQYFGTSRDLLAAPSVSTEDGSKDESTVDRVVQDGTPSDILAPVVRVSHEFDNMTLNRQSAALAERLGLRNVDAMEDVPKRDPAVKLSRAALSDPSLLRDVSDNRLTSPPRQRNRGVWNKSSKDFIYPAYDEQGVHGGEYSVRPNVQESMVFLRKLFTHQKNGAESVSKLISPPDAPHRLAQAGLRPRKGQMSPSRRRETQSTGAGSQLGVYALRKVPATSEVNRELERTKDMCLRNAEVCKSLGENEKSRVWSLLSQLVDMRLNENRSSFDGWGGFGGAAFGMSMVKNLLRYYESLGDVQMLSTIVCVLRDSRRQSDKPGLKLIPSGQDEKYDMYMHRYSDLLYGWGLLTIRAKLLKNLVRPFPSTELTQRIPGAPEGEHFEVSGIGLLFSCPRCGGDTEPGTNCCRSCQDYAFRCALCDNAIRGLFTVCKSCGHGGHMHHIKEWFYPRGKPSRFLCPTGCGCKCTFVGMKTFPTLEHIESHNEVQE